MTQPPNLDPVRNYFEERLDAHGTSARGADWNSEASQEARFDQLLKLCDPSAAFTILDYGSGTGALADYLAKKGFQADYTGFDILEKAIQAAKQQHTGKPGRTFTAEEASLPVCDYVVASGIFNFRADASFEAWTDYVTDVLRRFDQLSRKGFASNFLTKYSDADRMRADLYYADPCFLFDYCKRNFSKNVALLHDYTLYDFTLLVRKG
ncbi:MAG TPA: class I SAM-dependent methyltransferase [Anaerolineales bacterium]|nr:class I SAM-dependent methyltransferase [Anaerolineales bacterium]